MIVTTGRTIRIEVGRLIVTRCSDTPGKIDVLGLVPGHSVTVPANREDLHKFCNALWRAAEEAVEYRESKFE